MEHSRFDNWTRRRLGITAGGIMASLLGVTILDDVEANRKRRRQKRRCKRVTHVCRPSGKKKRCCRGLTCDAIPGLSGARCCGVLDSSCTDGDCCEGFGCDDITGKCLAG